MFTSDAAPGQDTYQIYVNDKDSAFAYYNGVSGDGSPQGDKLEFVLGTNKFNIKGWSGASRAEESRGWVSYGIENSNEQNGGGARTSLPGAAYSFTFEGTSVAFYAGAIPLQSNNSNQYGTFTVWLDGTEITNDPSKLVRSGPEASSYQWRGGSAVELLKIEAGGADQQHTVVVSSSGYNRVDYAVVGRQTPVSKEITVNVSGGGGPARSAWMRTGMRPSACIPMQVIRLPPSSIKT